MSAKDLQTKEEAHLQLKLKLLLKFEKAVEEFILVDHKKDALELKWFCNKENLWKLWDAVTYVPRKMVEFTGYVIYPMLNFVGLGLIKVDQ